MWYTSWMDRAAAIDHIVGLLEGPDEPTANTSMRLPDNLRKAAALAVGALGMAPSTTLFTAEALRGELEHVAFRAALDEHYAEHPQVRPTLAELALAMALVDGSDLAEDPGALERAATAVQSWKPDADADDVLTWAAGARWATA